MAQRSFLNPREVRKTAITTRIMQLVHEVLSKVCPCVGTQTHGF